MTLIQKISKALEIIFELPVKGNAIEKLNIYISGPTRTRFEALKNEIQELSNTHSNRDPYTFRKCIYRLDAISNYYDKIRVSC